MANSSDPRLSKRVLGTVDGRHVDVRPRTAMLLAVTAPSGPPHLALLSRAEVLAVADDLLRIALHANSRTSICLTRTTRATLLLADANGVETVGLSAIKTGSVEIGRNTLSLFDARVTDCREHSVPYATITSGITFELFEEAATTARWSATINVLRGGGPEL